MQYRNFLGFLLYFFMFFAAVCSYADEEVEDLVHIDESNGKILAVVKGRKSISFDLQPREQVLWSKARGDLGAVLTTRHFLVISTSSRAWQALPLRTSAADKRVPVLSPYIALLVTPGDRALGFDARSSRIIETRLPLNDELVAAKAEKHVAVVVTSSRAFGLAAGASHFSEFRLRVREKVEAINFTANKATIRTSHRLLAFSAEGARWSESRL